MGYSPWGHGRVGHSLAVTDQPPPPNSLPQTAHMRTVLRSSAESARAHSEILVW